MAKTSYPQKGETGRKMTSFYQKLLTRPEFIKFCSELRLLPSYASQWEVLDWIDNSNRLVFSADAIPAFPEFFSNFRSKTWSGPGYQIEWVTRKTGQSFDYRDLVHHLQNVRDESDSAKTLRCCLRIAGQPVEFTFYWDDSSSECTGFQINWFFGGFFLEDDFSAAGIKKEFEVGTPRAIPAEFRKLREEEVKNILTFLKGVRTPSGSGQMLAGASNPNRILNDFLTWSEESGLARSLESRIFLKRGPVNDRSGWNLDQILTLLRLSGADDVCITFDLQNVIPKDGRNYDVIYHEWLASLGGCRTLSGKCAIFGLGAFGNAPYGLVSTYIVHSGYVVGYAKIGSYNAKAPAELINVFSEADWIRGILPGGENFAHPVYNSSGEKADPVPETGVECQIKWLRQSLKRWVPLKAVVFEPNSFDGQYEKLSELGFEPEPPGEREDLLEQGVRSWYEEVPYLNMIIKMGVRHKLARCHRFWLVNFENPDSSLTPSDAFAILNGLTEMSIPTKGLKSSLIPGEVESWKINFQIGWDLDVEWVVEGGEKWFSTEFIMEFNTLLRSYGIGHLIYCIKLERDEMLLAGLKSDEAVALNSLLPKPFVPVNGL